MDEIKLYCAEIKGEVVKLCRWIKLGQFDVRVLKQQNSWLWKTDAVASCELSNQKLTPVPTHGIEPQTELAAWESLVIPRIQVQ